MRICDITQAYHGESGGIRTYLSHKQAYLASAGHEHLLIVPGNRDGIELQGGSRTVTLGSPIIPGCPPYRALIRRREIDGLLRAFRPDVIEFGDPYLAGWAAVSYTRTVASAAAVGFAHTDTPRAYFYPVVSRTLGQPAGRLARKLATRYVVSLYRASDAVVAASPTIAKALRRSQLPNTTLVPLGVDTQLFHPRRRDETIRRMLGVRGEERLLIY